MIKCIVCDMDGTLIRYDASIEEKTYHALKECINQGIEFIIATGRDINMVVDFLDEYQLDCDLILNNGTQYKNKERTINQLYPMDNESFKKIATILQDKGYLLAIHTNQGKYSFLDKEAFWDCHMKLLKQMHGNHPIPKSTFTTREGYLRDFHYAKDAQDIIDQGIQVLKIDARHIDENVVKGIREQLNIDYLDISSSYEANIEITTNQSNKGIMLEKVIKEKGYTKEEVAVFGDGANDIQMLEIFPYSFAPYNASDEAKQAAHYQLNQTNDEGAVFEGIEILRKKGLIA